MRIYETRICLHGCLETGNRFIGILHTFVAHAFQKVGFGIVHIATQYGIDLLAISQQNGFGFAYDARLAAAQGSQTKALVTTAGAIQWLSFNLAEWNAGITPVAGSNYSKTLVFTPAGVPCDLTMKDDCGNLSIVLTTTGKVVTLPTDIYEASDKYSGVNYVNCVSIVNP